MKTIQEVLSLSTQFLTDHQIERPRRIAEELLVTLEMGNILWKKMRCGKSLPLS